MMSSPIPFRPATPPSGTPAPEPTPEGSPAPEDQTAKIREVMSSVLDEVLTPYGKRLEQIEQRFAPPGPAPEEPAATDQDFYSRPADATTRIARAEAQREAGRVAGLAHRTALRILEGELSEKDPDFPLLEKEYREFAGTLNPDVLVHQFEDGTTGAERAFWQIKGRLARELSERRAAQEKEADEQERASAPRRAPFVERARGRPESRVSAGDRLTDEQKKVAKRLGLSEEQYLASVRAVAEGQQNPIPKKA